jgi:hypothetical protein
MKPLGTLRAFEKTITARVSPAESYTFLQNAFRWRNRVRNVAEDVANPHSRLSPCKWAFRMATCASVLKYFASLPNQAAVDAHAKFIEASPNVIIQWMKACAEHCRAETARCRREGINPETRLFEDCFIKAKTAILAWKKHLDDERAGIE